MPKQAVVNKLRTELFNQVPMSIAVIDCDNRIVIANKEFEKTYGDWKGKMCHEAYKHSAQICAGCKAKKTFESGKVFSSKEQGYNKDGKLNFYLVRYFPLFDDDGRVAFVVEMSADITEQVAIENEYKLIFDNVPCYITVIDRDFRVVKANGFFNDKFSHQGKTYCYEMYKNGNQPCEDCVAREVFKTGRKQRGLQTGIDKDGTESHYMTTVAPLLFDKGQVNLAIEISQDISEMMHLETQLEQAMHEKFEAERLAAVGQTIAGLSHTIKNILMGLEGGMYVVNSGLKRKDDGLVKQGWQMLESDISRISTIVKEFLSFAKGTKPNFTMADPVQIANDVIALFKVVCEQSGIELKGSFPMPVDKAYLDPEGIHTALTNLISNAIDACLVSDNKKLCVTLFCYEEDGAIVFRIKDNGCGMDYDTKQKIFTNFFTTKGSGQGTGLGLLMTRKIVSQHRGKIEVNTTEGEGSEFVIKFLRKQLPKPAE
ncbi:MAG: PAS domain-containing protein [Deltaproteobacteria bacterium]|nr:PAS domain-containing protein [Deltaproteobacteria bacterium]